MNDNKKRQRVQVKPYKALSGGWLNKLLSRHYGIALIICVIIMVGMWQNFYYQQLLLQQEQTKISLEEEHRRSLLYVAMREDASRPTNIKTQAEELGLRLLSDPPKKIKP